MYGYGLAERVTLSPQPQFGAAFWAFGAKSNETKQIRLGAWVS